MNDFPFDMRDIVYLLNFRNRNKGGTNWDVDCPFCGDSNGKMNINFKKNVYHCNRCDESGGMLKLYATLHNITNREAYDEIIKLLNIGKQATDYVIKKKEIEKIEPEVMHSPPASEADKNKTYTMLLSLLNLADSHKEKLLERGFSESQIEKNGYKSAPAFGFRKITEKLIKAGCIVKGVPGFYMDEDGEWTMNFHASCSGFLIPVVNIDGKIAGMQIRIDRPFKKRKYIWLSSVNKHMGASSGSPIHFVGDVHGQVVFVTEGPLKGDLSYFFSGKTFACVAGANQYCNLESLFIRMREFGVRQVMETYDIDKLTNEHVKKGSRQFFRIANECNLEAKQITWNPKYKGIDEYLYSLELKKKK